MDKLKSRIEELEVHNRGQDFEIRKLKEAIVLLEAKINKKPSNYFEYTDSETDEENSNYFYLDNISGV